MEEVVKFRPPQVSLYSRKTILVEVQVYKFTVVYHNTEVLKFSGSHRNGPKEKKVFLVY